MGRYNYTSLRYIEAIEREVEMNNKAINELSKFYARIPWTFYGHFTTLDDLNNSEKYTEYWQKRVLPNIKIPDDLVLIYWKRVIRKISEELYGVRYKRKNLGISWVMGIEQNKDGSHKHIHIVMYGEGLWKYHRNCIRALWEKAGLRTGMSRLEEYDWRKFEEKGLFYLAKHQIKRNNIVDFITKRHNLFFLQGEPFWWKKYPEEFKKFNNIVPRCGKVPPLGQLSLFGDYVCFGHCEYLHQSLQQT